MVSTVSDGSSYNIYIYRGYNRINITHILLDNIYILSVPLFIWIKAYSGQYKHGRSRNKCINVYLDQIFVLKGIFKGEATICLDGRIIQVFNLNTL